MSRYDEYVSKIEKIKAVRGKVYHYRIPLIALGTVVLASVTGLLSTKGMILSDLTIENENIVYGDEFSIRKGSCFLGNTSLQYREEDSSMWSKESPSHPGTYYVREVSSRSFGGKSYGKEHKISIAVKEVNLEITSSSTEYGNDPQYKIDLVKNDKISNIGFIYGDLTLDNTTVSCDLSSLKIINDEGNDVTSFYNIITETKDIEITQTDLVLSMNISSRVYDGTADISFSSGSKINASLKYNDEVTYSYNFYDENNEAIDAPVKPGEYVVRVDGPSVVIKNGEYDVTSHYNISTPENEFSIFKRSITVTTGSFEKEYDGSSLSSSFDNLTYSVSDNSLLKEDKTEIDGIGKEEFFALTDAFEMLNDFAIRIKDGNDEDVTSCYDINYVYGSLKITPKNIVVRPLLTSKITQYDGNNHFYEGYYGNYEYVGDSFFINGDNINISVLYNASINISNNSTPLYSSYSGSYYKDAGNYSVQIVSYDPSSEKISNNYNIFYENAYLSVTPRDITLELHDVVHTYDGKYYVYGEGYILSSLSKDSIVEGDSFTFSYLYTDASSEVNPCDAGTYSVSLKEGSVVSSSYYCDYSVKVISSSLIINPREIYVKPVNQEKTYDGGEFVYPSQEYEYYGESLTNEENRFIENEISSSSSFEISVREENSLIMKNAGTYSLIISDFSKTGVDSYKTSNYHLNTEKAALIINKREVSIKPKDYDGFVYDGTVHTYPYEGNENFLVLSSSIVNGDEFEISVSVTGECKNAGEYVSSIISVNENDNYAFTFETGKIIVNKRNIFIEPVSYTKEYDGQVYSYPLYRNNFIYDNLSSDDKNYQLVGDESLIINVGYYDDNILASARNVLSSERSYEGRIISYAEGENTLLSNYNVTVSSSSLRINPRKIIIRPLDYEGKIYDGITYTYPSYMNNFEYVSSSHLVEGESFEAYIAFFLDDKETSPLDAGSYRMSVSYVSEGENTLLSNYEISYESSYFEIGIRNVIISLYDFDDFVYDGNYVTYRLENYSYTLISSLDIAEGETLCGNVYFSDNATSSKHSKVKDAGDYVTYVNDYDILSSRGLSTKKNYSLSFDVSEFTISPRSVYVAPAEESYVYSGSVTEHSSLITYADLSYSDASYQFVNGESFVIGSINSYYYVNGLMSVSEPVDAGTYLVHDYSLIQENTASLLSNYSFTLMEGTMYINPRTINIEPVKEEIIYDGHEYYYSEKSNNFAYSSGNSYTLCNDDSIIISVIYDGDESLHPCDVKEDYNDYISSVGNINLVNGKQSNYEIITYSSTLSIRPRTIYIAPDSIRKVYDGVTYEYPSGSMNFGYTGLSIDDTNYCLVDGQKIEIVVSYDGSLTAPKNVKGDEDSYTVQISSVIYGDNTRKENYNIVGSSATYTITRRNLYISLTAFENKIFDDIFYSYTDEYGNYSYSGLSLSNARYRLASDEEMKICATFDDEKLGSVKDAGQHYLYYSSFDIRGNDSSYNNYNLNLEKSYFEISPLEVHILPLDVGEYVYSASAYVYPEFGENGSSNVEFTLSSVLGDDVLSVSVKFKDSEGNYINSCIEPDTYYIVIDESSYVIYNGLLSNYQFVCDGERSFEIVRRSISIAPSSELIDALNAVYNNKPVSYPHENGNYIIVSSEGAYATPTLSVEVEFVSYDDENQVYQNNAVLNSGKYKVRIISHNYDNSVDQSRFDVIYTDNPDGTIFEISKRNLSIAPEDVTRSYSLAGYNVYSSDDINILNGSFADGESGIISLKYTLQDSETKKDSLTEITTPADVGIYYIHIENCQLSKGDISLNYNLTFEEGILTINQRDIYIMPLSMDSRTYDKTESSYPSYETGNFLYYGDSLTNSSNKLEDGQEICLDIDFFLKDSEGNYVSATPTNAGVYYEHIKQVHAADENTVLSNYNFITADQSFEIYKRKIKVSPSEEFVLGGENYLGSSDYYDGNQRYYSSESMNYSLDLMGGDSLIEGDEFHIDSVTFSHNEYKDVVCKNANDYIISVSSYSFSGSESENYEVELGELSYIIRPRILSLQFSGDDLNKVYDGNSYDINSYKDKFILSAGYSLVEGDVLDFTLSLDSAEGELSLFRDSGDYIVKCASFTINGADSENYEVDVNYAFLISKADLIIVLSDIEDMTYTGYEINGLYSSSAYESLSGFYDDSLTFDVNYFMNGETASVRNAGTYSYMINTSSCLVNSSVALDKNYNVFCEEKSFEIIPYTVYIKPKDDIVYYSGEEYVYSGEFIDKEGILGPHGLLGDDAVSVMVSFLQDDEGVIPVSAGTYVIKITGITYLENTKESNYNIIIYEDAALEIKPEEISIRLSDAEKEYSSETYVHDLSYELTKGTLYGDDTIMIDSMHYEDEKGNKVIPVNAGTYFMVIDEWHFENGVSKNYSVTAEEKGTLNILYKEVGVVLYSFEDKIYDDAYISYPEGEGNYQYLTEDNSLLSFEISLAYINTETGEISEDVRYAGTYLVTISEVMPMNEFSANYTLVLTDEITFTISKRKIKVITGASVSSIEYDGYEYDFVRSEQVPYTEHPLLAYFALDEESQNAILPYQYAEMSKSSPSFSVKDAGIYEVKISADVRREKDGEDLTSNYDIEYVYGTFEVIKRYLLVKTADHPDMEYTSNNIASSFNKLSDEITLLDGTAFTENTKYKYVNIDYSAVNVGTYQNLLSLDLKDDSSNSLLDNYDIHYVYGLVNIVPKKMNVYLPDINKVYDGKEKYISINDLICEEGTPEFGKDNAVLVTEIYDSDYKKMDKGLLDAGTYYIFISDILINGESYKNSINYNLTIVNNLSSYTIDKLALTIITQNGYFAYVPLETFSKPEVTYNVDGVDKDVIYSFVIRKKDGGNYATVSKPGIQVENIVEYEILLNGEDASANFDITEEWGTLEISDKIELNSNCTSSVFNNKTTSSDYLTLTTNTDNVKVQITDFEFYQYSPSNIVSAKDAGMYSIKVAEKNVKFVYNSSEGSQYLSDELLLSTDEGMNCTYEDGYYYIERGMYIIPASVYLKPTDKSKYYDGSAMGYTSDDYEFIEELTYTFKGADGVKKQSTLYGLSSLYSGVLKATINCTKTNATQQDVFIKDYILYADLSLSEEMRYSDEYLSYLTDGSDYLAHHKYNNYFVYTSLELASGIDESELSYNDIKKFSGSFEIKERQVYVKTYGATKVYDGTPLQNLEGWYYIPQNKEGYDLLSSHHLELSSGDQYSVTSATGNSPRLNQLYFSVYDDNGNKVNSNNYKIVYMKDDDSYLVVEKRVLHLTTGSATMSYDGSTLTCSSIWAEDGELLEGHILQATLTGSINYVGTTRNTVKITSIKVMKTNYRANGTLYYTDVTSNYLISAENITYGTLEITYA